MVKEFTHLLSRCLYFIMLTSIGLLLSYTPATSEEKYDYRERGKNRMEGKQDVPSASLDLRVVSFLGYREDISFSSKDVLKLKFFVRTEEPIFITASEINPVHYYFMRPLRSKWPSGWQIFSPWQASEVLIPLGIPIHNLGIIARIGSTKEGSGQLAPLLLYTENPPPKIASYKMILVSRENLSKMQYTLSRIGTKPTSFQQNLHKDFPAETPIILDLNLKDEQANMFELTVKGKIRNSNEGPKRTYTFFHNPSASQ